MRNFIKNAESRAKFYQNRRIYPKLCHSERVKLAKNLKKTPSLREVALWATSWQSIFKFIYCFGKSKFILQQQNIAESHQKNRRIYS
ncbi:hypothetical protein ACWIUD_00985 [Helicobacter sp. 23-1044]